jgi:hypothetical protein
MCVCVWLCGKGMCGGGGHVGGRLWMWCMCVVVG